MDEFFQKLSWEYLVDLLWTYLLPLFLAIPALGALACAFAPARSAKWIALLTSLVSLALAIPLIAGFNWQAPQEIQLVSDLGGIALGSFREEAFNVRFGVDSISLWLIVLTVFLQPLAIAASFQSIAERQKEYYAWMLILLAAMLGVFMARDALLFYVFFELTLIPMFFIIGIWGGPQRRYAAGKFFLFTFAGGVFTLATLIYLGVRYETFDISSLIRLAQVGDDNDLKLPLGKMAGLLVVLGFLAGFAVKVPLFPVHTWLPLAHTEAPTAGSVILAGVLLKLGTYGILRLVLPLGLVSSVEGAGTFTPMLIKVIGLLCLVGIIYGALVAWVQQDIKKLVAYSSVSHLGFCVLGIAALNQEGIQGSILYMINHGLSTGALFLVVGMIYDRYHTRDINQLSGLARRMPILSFFFVLFALSSIGLPGLNGFVSEFLTILGAFKSEHLGIPYGAVAALGIILGAVYMLHMVARVVWGPLKTPGTHGEGHGHAHDTHPTPGDINAREIGILVPLALAVVVLGVVPWLVLGSLKAPVDHLMTRATQLPGPKAPPKVRDDRQASAPAPVRPAVEAAGQATAGEERSAEEPITHIARSNSPGGSSTDPTGATPGNR